MVQLLRLCASTTEGMSSIPGQGTEILHAALWGKKTRKSLKRTQVRFTIEEHGVIKRLSSNHRTTEGFPSPDTIISPKTHLLQLLSVSTSCPDFSKQL